MKTYKNKHGLEIMNPAWRKLGYTRQSLEEKREWANKDLRTQIYGFGGNQRTNIKKRNF